MTVDVYKRNNIKIQGKTLAVEKPLYPDMALEQIKPLGIKSFFTETYNID